MALSSSGASRLASRWKDLPSKVTEGNPLKCPRAFSSSMDLSCIFWYLARVSAPGLMITIPCSPSRITMSPILTRWLTSERPTTAGISRVWARIAVWLVLPPRSVANPRIRLSERPKVSEGRRLRAIRTQGWSISARERLVCLSRCWSRRLPTSKRSCRRSRKNSSSIFSNCWLTASSASDRANSALTRSFRIRWGTSWVMRASRRMKRWASIRRACFLPRTLRTLASAASKSRWVAFWAALKRLTSAFRVSAGSSTRLTTISSSSRI